ncbi:unnamed protein product [Eruca vesicaria subsp. sativa]|uniref:Hydroxyproline-rich glycoprotein family protein n=1 Tax=Eruca vesicaria subsp. sativa TaxID=29727 RepID=A0ABC8LLQ4_ERUVS|nr:unnamed protein product [Eruca vesicaria subsp. sativa]
MRNVNNSIDTVSAAASAIFSSSQSRAHSSTVQKKKWGSCWSLYWCFGSQKNNKRIGHAVLVPEPVTSGSAPEAPVQNSSSNSTSTFLPFIAPPSSPASFLQSGPPSMSHTPHGLLSLTVNTYSLNEPSSAFEIGPYAHETQPVTPPVDSAYTTRPSTAPFTPPPESGQMSSATPSSPEVPFAQLLTSSLERCGGVNQNFSAEQYEFQSYQLGFEDFTARKWGSRFGSGSITPAGQGSGALTPDGGGGYGSKLDSGNLTSLEGCVFGYSDHGSSWNDEAVTVAHRVSFECGDLARCFASKLNRVGLDEQTGFNEAVSVSPTNRWSDETWGERESELSHKLRTFSLGSSKEFKFDNTEEVVRTEWWADEKVGDDSLGNSWSFFPVLRSGGFS